MQGGTFAQQEGLEVFYHPIEQNYNTPEDASWFTDSETWPSDTERVVGIVKELRELKRQGLPIANSPAQLDAMIPYFVNPARSRIAIQSHSAHEPKQLCSALTMLQFEANGDVIVCNAQPAIGNIKSTPIREIWQNRPRWWEGGCCLERRLNDCHAVDAASVTSRLGKAPVDAHPMRLLSPQQDPNG